MEEQRRNLRDLPLALRTGGLNARDRVEIARLERFAATAIVKASLRKRQRLTTPYKKAVRAAIEALRARAALLRPVEVARMSYRQVKRQISDYSDDEAWNKLRFKPAQLLRLLAAVGFPSLVWPENGSIFSGEEALLFLLRRMAYPGRLSDYCQEFGRDPTQLSRLFNWAVDFLYNKFQPSLGRGAERWVPYFGALAAAVSLKTGAPDGRDDIVGFIDGTVRPICRPEPSDYPGAPDDLQRAVYSGHKHVHALKYQAVMMANGIIADVFGPVPGPRHDSLVLTRCASVCMF